MQFLKNPATIKNEDRFSLGYRSLEKATLLEKPHCLNFWLFRQLLVGIEMHKVRAMIGKPFYIGLSDLEFSKLIMAEFHYEVVTLKYGEKAQLLFAETDSLI